LLELQEAVHDALRLVNRAHIEDTAAHYATKEWGKNMLSDEVNEGIRLAQRRVGLLIERVSDDDLRTSVKGLMDGATRVLFTRTKEQADFQINKTAEDAEKVLQSVGTVLRRHL